MKLSAEFDRNIEARLFERLLRGVLPRSRTRGLYLDVVSNLSAEGVEHLRRWVESDSFVKSIVRLTKRPSFLIQGGTFDVDEDDFWFETLNAHRVAIETALPGCGRIELLNHPTQTLAGSGFLVARDVIATNRHVTRDFIERKGKGVAWIGAGTPAEIRGQIDFLAEHQYAPADKHLVTDVLHLEADSGPDLALLRIAGEAPLPLNLAAADPEVDDLVASVGYPWRETPPTAEVGEAMEDIFHGIFEVKRLAPGKVTGFENGSIAHDCTNLVGSSGSALIDLETGAIVGVDFRASVENLAVPVSLLRDRLTQL